MVCCGPWLRTGAARNVTHALQSALTHPSICWSVIGEGGIGLRRKLRSDVLNDEQDSRSRLEQPIPILREAAVAPVAAPGMRKGLRLWTS